jgi:uncharacterized protein YkwD
MRRTALALMVTCAGAALPACSGDSATPQSADSSVLQFCVDETNRFRAMDGKGPIARSATLEAFAAEGAAQDTEAQQAHGHFGRQGDHLVAFAENACPSWLGWTLGDGPNAEKDAVGACLKAFYDEGPGGGHYENLMSDNSHVGCGLYEANGGITIIQDFGPE